MKAGDWKAFIQGKRATQLGLGLLGRGINDAAFLAEHGALLTVTDKKDAKELAPALKKLKKFSKQIEYVLGEHRLSDFRERDFILKAAGVPLNSPEIAQARKNGIPIEMDASLFAKLAPPGVILVGVTGTRGKSTTTHLIYHILKAAKRRVFLGGNVKDTATLPLLEKVRSGDVVVLELDSWQLQGFGEAKLSPQIAVFTTFMDDHLNYYNNDRAAYFADKANIFKYQKAGDTLVVGGQAAQEVNRASPPISPVVVSSADIPTDWKTKLPGEHNRENISCAIAAVRALGIAESVIQKAVASFSGVPGRLQLVRSVRGVSYYDDTTATTPDALVVGLAALSQTGEKRITLIMGGADKGLSLSALPVAFEKFVLRIILLPGTGTDRLLKEYPAVRGEKVSSMKVAVIAARRDVRKGDIILLSPGFASFGLFSNEYDRGEQYVKAVKGLN